MPLTAKGSEILSAMEREYGSKKGESVFYASKNAGKITGVDGQRTDADLEKHLQDLKQQHRDAVREGMRATVSNLEQDIKELEQKIKEESREKALSGRADMVGASTLEKLDAAVRICDSMAQQQTMELSSKIDAFVDGLKARK